MTIFTNSTQKNLSTNNNDNPYIRPSIIIITKSHSITSSKNPHSICQILKILFLLQQLRNLLHGLLVDLVMVLILLVREDDRSGVRWIVLFLRKVLVEVLVALGVPPFVTVELEPLSFFRHVVVLGVPYAVVQHDHNQDYRESDYWHAKGHPKETVFDPVVLEDLAWARRE